jgi:glycosyltransferase involved in cell wall biosynthesis
MAVFEVAPAIPQDPPLVSIVTVVLDAGELFARTMDSILSQDYGKREIIVVDGMSQDPGTVRLLETYRGAISVLIREKDAGIYDAMNKGLAAARGEYVQFLNCGDQLASAGVLSTVAARSRDRPGIIYGDALVFGPGCPEGRLLEAKPFTRVRLAFWGTRVACHQSMFVRTDLAEPYRLRYRLKAELDWYFGLCSRMDPGSVVHVHAPFARYLTGGTTHQRILENTRERLKVVLDRGGPGLLALCIPGAAVTLALNARFAIAAAKERRRR